MTDHPTRPVERFSSPKCLQENVLKKTNHASTMRHLTEKLHKSKSVRFMDSDPSLSGDFPGSPSKFEKQKEGVYFHSANLYVRLLSPLIILRTLSQADLLASVFDFLRSDLKSDVAKELFLYYQATLVITHYLKPVNKMSTDSPFLQKFLESCSTESCFRTVAIVLGAPRQDVKLLKKVSILLQKLSNLRSNVEYHWSCHILILDKRLTVEALLLLCQCKHFLEKQQKIIPTFL